ncbi:hypothetical protein F5X96DRAFT_667898 [Biscogniauxia mediterranea]|nr:hypothetical protein F5X96DRAFT_667898 [Biscogniauxia mediterranea]
MWFEPAVALLTIFLQQKDSENHSPRPTASGSRPSSTGWTGTRRTADSSTVTRRSAIRGRQDLKAWTEDYLMVWEELAVMFPPREMAPQAAMSREKWMQLFADATKETENGVVMHQGSVAYVMGRKAL